MKPNLKIFLIAIAVIIVIYFLFFKKKSFNIPPRTLAMFSQLCSDGSVGDETVTVTYFFPEWSAADYCTAVACHEDANSCGKLEQLLKRDTTNQNAPHNINQLQFIIAVIEETLEQLSVEGFGVAGAANPQ